MTRADRPTADSWVHLAPTRAMRVALPIAMVWAMLLIFAAALLGVLQLVGLIPRFNTTTSTMNIVIGTVVLLAISAAAGWFAWLLIQRAWRNGSFGTRPSGVALGETHVAVRVPGRDKELAWAHIRSVEFVMAPMGHRGQPIAMFRLVLTPESGMNEQLLQADGYKVPSSALYSALRWYHAHPAARWELGRIEGERRIEGWRQAALALR